MRVVEIADTAKQDLEYIWEYIAQRNPESANKFIKTITQKFILLRDFLKWAKHRTNFLLTFAVSHSKTTLSFINQLTMVLKFCAYFMVRVMLKPSLKISSIRFDITTSSQLHYLHSNMLSFPS